MIKQVVVVVRVQGTTNCNCEKNETRVTTEIDFPKNSVFTRQTRFR